MSNYVFGTSLSYNDYLVAKSLSDDISSTSDRIKFELFRSTKEIIASNKVLQNIGFEIIESQINSASVTKQGFDILSIEMHDLKSEMYQLNSSLQWGFSQVLSSLEHINNVLYNIEDILYNPVQTPAYNHYRNAKDAFSRRLYDKALIELDYAINGVQGVSAGYTLEWRFYHMIGTIKMGFIGCDLNLIDLQEAEKAYLESAKIAEIKFPYDAANTLLSAWWAAYCQGRFDECVKYLKNAITLNNNHIEAKFLLSKTYAAKGEIKEAFSYLRQAIASSLLYSIRAADDEDFHKYELDLNEFLSNLTTEYYKPILDESINLKSTYESIMYDFDIQLENVLGNTKLMDFPDVKKEFEQLKKWLPTYKLKYNKLIQCIDIMTEVEKKTNDLVNNYNTLFRFKCDYVSIEPEYSNTKNNITKLKLEDIDNYLDMVYSIKTRIENTLFELEMLVKSVYNIDKLKHKEFRWYWTNEEIKDFYLASDDDDSGCLPILPFSSVVIALIFAFIGYLADYADDPAATTLYIIAGLLIFMGVLLLPLVMLIILINGKIRDSSLKRTIEINELKQRDYLEPIYKIKSMI